MESAHARGQAFISLELVWLQWGVGTFMPVTVSVNPHNGRRQTTPRSRTLMVALTAIHSAIGVKIQPTN